MSRRSVQFFVHTNLGPVRVRRKVDEPVHGLATDVEVQRGYMVALCFSRSAIPLRWRFL